jgi:ABC-type antimicrobial peptide transport system permease subunit
MAFSYLIAIAPGLESGSLFFKGIFIVVFALILYFSREKKSQNIEKPE